MKAETLVDALGVRGGEVVALVGGGGKTTTMFVLARELAGRGRGVLATTTTRILRPTTDQAPCLLIESTLDGLLSRLPRCLERHPLAVLGSGLDSDGKVLGIDPDWVGPLLGLTGVGNIIIEADGAAGRPFKAPRSHEPVIPGRCDLVVPVVGIEAVGRVLDEKRVHRADRVAALASMDLGQSVTAEVVALVLLHPEGNIKGAPVGARVVPLINKVDDDTLRDSARELARRLLERGAGRVVLAHTAFEPRVVEVLEVSGQLQVFQ